VTALRTAADHLVDALAPLGEALASPGGFRALMGRLGWDARIVPPEWSRLADDLAATRAAVDGLADDPELLDVLAVAEAVGGVATTIGGLSTAPPDLDATAVLADLRDSLLEHLVIEHAARKLPAAFGILRLVGVIAVERRRAEPGRLAHTRHRIDRARIRELAGDPGAWLRSLYGWGGGELLDAAVLGGLLDAALRLGVRARISRIEEALPVFAGLGVGDRVVDLPLVDAVVAGSELRLGIQVAVLTAAPGKLPGLVLAPRIPGLTTGTPLPLGPNADLRLVTGAGAPIEVALLVRPDDASVAWPGAGFAEGIGAELAIRAPLVLGRATGTRLELAGVTIGLHVDRDDRGDLIEGRIRVDGLACVLAGGDQDGVMARVLGGRELRVPVPIELRLSSRDGIALAAGAIDVALAGSLSFGPVTLRDPHLGLVPGDVVAAEVTAGVAVAIGPVELALDRLGARVALDTTAPGTLGFGALDAGPVWPTGGGIAIDAGIVAGAGHVARDAATGSYEGAVRLRVAALEVQGAVLVSSRGPDGAPLTSVAALVAARFPGIQLGFGFTLDGLGAVFAMNRRADDVALRAAVRAGQLAGLLFPSDAKTGLGTVLARMRELFPVAAGRFVAGPSARLGWGTPRVFAADVAVLIEAPAPFRVLVLGSASLGLPTLDHRIVDINLDVLGIVDFARKTVAIDASLHHSSIAGYELTGDMALRAGWGDSPHFLLAIGGFHPRFTPPPSFPALRRVALVIGDNPSLRLEAYLALTSNTVQLGARVDLSYRASGLKIAGQLHFDALVEIRPLKIEAELGASVSISYRGHNIASASLDFILTGPRPWHAHGTATIGILWWDVSVGFDVTWGEAAQPALPPPPDLRAILRDALAEPRAIGGELPPGERAWIVTRDAPAGDLARIHPLATVVIRQRAVPLEYRMTRFASAPLPAPLELRITGARVGTAPPVAPAPTAVRDSFALGQFSDLRDDELLAAPSFESMPSGIRIGDGAVALGPVARAPVDPVTVVDDPLAPPAVPPPRTVMTPVLLGFARPPRAAVPPPAVIVRAARYALASTLDLAPVDPTGPAGPAGPAAPDAGPTTFAALRERTRGLRATVQVVDVTELAT
jgi:hypothetical protein